MTDLEKELVRGIVKNAVREAMNARTRSAAEIKSIIDSASDSIDAYANPEKYGITKDEEKAFGDWERKKKAALLEHNEKIRRKNIKDDYKALHP